jgi:hypothetical protein
VVERVWQEFDLRWPCSSLRNVVFMAKEEMSVKEKVLTAYIFLLYSHET